MNSLKMIKRMWWLVQLMCHTLDEVFDSFWSGKPICPSGAKSDAPWIPLPAIQFLQGYDLHGLRVFEWGSGGSTKYFIENQGVIYIESVETDPEWAAAMIKYQLAQRTGCLRVLPVTYPVSAMDLHHYAQTINRSEVAKPSRAFNVVLVDGLMLNRARTACVLATVASPNFALDEGMILVDNADWDNDFIRSLPTGWHVTSLIGFPLGLPYETCMQVLIHSSAADFWRRKLICPVPLKGIAAPDNVNT